MAIPTDRQDFPNCANCPYFRHGSWNICWACVSEQLPDIVNPCKICSQEESADSCKNQLCQQEQRHVEYIRAAKMDREPLCGVLRRFKDGEVAWGFILARMLIGYLVTHRKPSGVDLIIANPSNPGREHIELVFRQAAEFYSGNRWNFDSAEDPAITKNEETRKAAGQGLQGKKQAAIEHAEAMVLKHPDRIAGKRVVVYDDICTTGHQLNEVARRLKEEWGATKVYGIVLARHPWQN